MKKLTCALIALSAALSLSSTVQAQGFDQLYTFGDSLSDVGNVFASTGGFIPAPPYFNGRFTNGPNWVDQFSTKLNLAPQQPYVLGGANSAFGAAVTGNAVPFANTQVPNIGQQVDLFSSSHGGVASPNSLYAVWIGSNDISTAIQDLIGGVVNLNQARADLAQAAADEAAAVNTLASEGAKHFLIPLVPDLGLTPASRALGVSALSTALSRGYDDALRADLNLISSSRDVHLTIFDTFGLIDSAFANPGAFGLTDVFTPCYLGVSVCGNPDQHLFWDFEHPTTAADAFVATAAFVQLSAVPEPKTWALLLLGAAGLALFRRRAVAQSVSAV